MDRADWPQAWLQERLGYAPREERLFRAALTHRSAPGPNNERLEFLGDAVLTLVVARHLFEAFPGATEGDLSRLRARLVSAEPLAAVAASIELGEALKLGTGELKTGGFRRESILADALEALFGAVFLDGGLDAAEALIIGLLAPRLASLPAPQALKDPKTRLQEHLQSRGLALPAYSVDGVEGEPHAQIFAVRCRVADLGLEAQGRGSSRRRAEQEAAGRILALLESGCGPHPS